VTDGFIVGKANGRKVKLMGTFVESPLVWAVVGAPTSSSSAPTSSSISAAPVGFSAALSPSVLGRAPRFGISRKGSGSQTMAHYACSLHDIDSVAPEFVIANNFAGLKAGTSSNR
jgi:hypothetical protein